MNILGFNRNRIISSNSTPPTPYGNFAGYFEGGVDYDFNLDTPKKGYWLETPYTSDFDLSYGDIIIEAYFNAVEFSYEMAIVASDTYGSNFDWSLLITNNTTLRVSTAATSQNLYVTVPTMNINQWYHFKFERVSGVNTIYLDGIAYGSNTMLITNSSQTRITVGSTSWSNPGAHFHGYLDNIHISRNGIDSMLLGFETINNDLSSFTDETGKIFTIHPDIQVDSLLSKVDIVRNNLVLNFDPVSIKSYIRSGVTVKNSTNESETGGLINGATWSSIDGSIILDGVDDYINFQSASDPPSYLVGSIGSDISFVPGYTGVTTFYLKKVSNNTIIGQFDVYQGVYSSFTVYSNNLVSSINSNTISTGFSANDNGNGTYILYSGVSSTLVYTDYSNSDNQDLGAGTWMTYSPNSNGGFYGLTTISYPVRSFDPNGVSNFSVSSWFRNGNDTGGLVTWLLTSASDYGIEMELYSGSIYIAFSSSDYGVYYYGVVGQWVNLSYTYDGGGVSNDDRLKLFINGTQVILNFGGTIPSTINTSGAKDLTIGLIRSGVGYRYIQDRVGQVLVYKSTLSVDDVRRNYNALKTSFI